MDAIIGPTGIRIHLSRCMIISFNLPGRVLARAVFGRHGPLSIHARAHVRHRRSARECCSADQRLLPKITIAEDAHESYTPQGIEKGIDFEGPADILRCVVQCRGGRSSSPPHVSCAQVAASRPSALARVTAVCRLFTLSLR